MNNKIALTISPPDRRAKYSLMKVKNPCRAVYDDDIHIIRRALNRSSNDYELFPEFDMTGRLHYHGYVVINNMTNWKSYSTAQLTAHLGYIKVKTNVNSKWLEYCMKEWQQTSKILDVVSPIRYEPLKRGPKIKLHEEEIKNSAKKRIILEYL